MNQSTQEQIVKFALYLGKAPFKNNSSREKSLDHDLLRKLQREITLRLPMGSLVKSANDTWFHSTPTIYGETKLNQREWESLFEWVSKNTSPSTPVKLKVGNTLWEKEGTVERIIGRYTGQMLFFGPRNPSRPPLVGV